MQGNQKIMQLLPPGKLFKQTWINMDEQFKCSPGPFKLLLELNKL